MKRRCKIRRLYKVFLAGIGVTFVLSLILFASMNSVPEGPIQVIFQNDEHERYSNFEFRSENDLENIQEPLETLVSPSRKTLQFWNLPKRKFGRTYGELTSANRDTSYPLAPDFTFHIEYEKNSVTLYEDYGPGCIFRLFMLPNLPTDFNIVFKMTAQNLTTSSLHFLVDGENFFFSLREMMLASDWPFTFPISVRHKKLSTGIGAYTPICYQHHMKIVYKLPEDLPENLFEETIKCSANDMLCPVKIYSAVSRHKFPYGRGVSSFAELKTEGTWLHKVVLSNVLHTISHPHKHGPHWGDNCVLTCVDITNKQEVVIFSSDKPGVISTIRMRVYDPVKKVVMPDWMNLLVTMTFDDAVVPQLNRVPLGSLFGATASLNDVLGVSLGKMVQSCTHENRRDHPPDGVTGYFYFPMPYWKSLKILIEGSRHLSHRVTVCHQVLVVDNMYEEEKTAYFHAIKTYYSGDVNGWRTVVKLDDAWGSFVGLLMDVDNLYAVRGVQISQRWAALQADPVIYVDDSKSASVLGTGLEDYFSYSHGFAFAENTSYAFVGVHHASPRWNEPLTWHCYRLHVLDPIPFHKSLHFIMEGTSKAWHKPEKALSYDNYMKQKKSGKTTISHLALFYAKRTSGLTKSDEILIGNSESEKTHNYTLITANTQSHSGDVFALNQKSFLGSYTSDRKYNVSGRMHSKDSKMSFILKIPPQNKGVILRREFYSSKHLWNQKARMSVNGHKQGVWYIPMCALVEQYSLQNEDFMIGSSVTVNQTSISVRIEPLTTWYDISYAALAIN